MKRKICILPQLNNCGGDLAKKWFIYFSVRNPKTGRMERFKQYSPLGKFSDPGDRTLAAGQIIADLSERLRHGWTPFSDSSGVIYEDNLEYDHITRIYGKRRAQNRSIRYWASSYIESLSGALDPEGTLSTYKSKLRIFTAWYDSRYDSENDAVAVTNEVVVRFFRWLIDDEKRSGKTVHDYRYILSGLFEYLIREKIFLSNPVHDLPICRRVCDMAPAPIHEADIAVFKNELIRDQQLWLAVQFQYYCALRPGRELRLLKIKDIDLVRGQVTVARSQAKTRITRTVVIPVQFLQELRTTYRIADYNKEYFVFSVNGQPGRVSLGKNNLRYRFNTVRKKLGMPTEYKFYSWKHTGGVMASLSGIPDSHIQRQMGHSSIDTTSRYLRKMTGFQSDFLRNRFPGI